MLTIPTDFQQSYMIPNRVDREAAIKWARDTIRNCNKHPENTLLAAAGVLEKNSRDADDQLRVEAVHTRAAERGAVQIAARSRRIRLFDNLASLAVISSASFVIGMLIYVFTL